MAHGIIYGLHDPRTGELRYIGQTTKATPEERRWSHLAPSSLKQHTYLARWLSGLVKNGLVPTCSIICTANSQPELDELEIKHIAEARSRGVRLVNMSDGGGGRAGVPQSEEWKARMSEQKRGKNTNTPEHIARLAEMKRGVPRSEETKAKIRAAKLGTKLTEEHKAKIAASSLGKFSPKGEASGRWKHGVSTDEIMRRYDAGEPKKHIAAAVGMSEMGVAHRIRRARAERAAAPVIP